MGDECDKFGCDFTTKLPSIKYKLQLPGYMVENQCLSHTNIAGYFQVFKKDTGYIYRIQKVCYDRENSRWWFNLADENSFIINYVISVCTTNIYNAGKELIKDYRFFPANYDCDSIKRDLEDEKKYGNRKGRFFSEKIILLHEEEHLKEFKNTVNDLLGLLHNNLIETANKLNCNTFNSIVEAEMFWGSELDKIYLDWYESVNAYYLGITHYWGTESEKLQYEIEIHNRILPEIMLYILAAKLYHGCN